VFEVLFLKNMILGLPSLGTVILPLKRNPVAGWSEQKQQYWYSRPQRALLSVQACTDYLVL
jgi:hypothetical protein